MADRTVKSIGKRIAAAIFITLLLLLSGCSLYAPETVTLYRGESAKTQSGLVVSYREYHDPSDKGILAVNSLGQPTKVYKKLQNGDSVEYTAGTTGNYFIQVLCASNYCGQFRVTKM
ncbi:MAG: hypothetical protein ACM3QZ_10175 [Solirubrobacterales bacterium]